MKKILFKVIGVTFALALVLNVVCTQSIKSEDPPLHGANTINQLHIS